MRLLKVFLVAGIQFHSSLGVLVRVGGRCRKSTKNQFMEMIKALKANKAKKDDLVVSRAEAEKLQNLCTDLRSQLNAATAQESSTHPVLDAFELRLHVLGLHLFVPMRNY